MGILITIIIPLFNKSNTIRSTIDSILSQKVNDLEIIVVDDGSTDDGVEVVRSYIDERIRLFQKENGGPSSARNFGLQQSNGKWVMFLDADDILVEGALSRLEETICISDCGIIAGNFYTQKNGELAIKCKIRKEGSHNHPFLSYLLKSLYLRPGSYIVRRKIAVNYMFNESYVRNEDLEYALKLLQSEMVFCVTFPIMIYNKEESFFSHPCKDFNKDYLAHLDINNKSFFYRLYIYRLYKRGIRIYGNSFKSLYASKDYNKMEYILVSYIVKILLKIKNYTCSR